MAMIRSVSHLSKGLDFGGIASLAVKVSSGNLRGNGVSIIGCATVLVSKIDSGNCVTLEGLVETNCLTEGLVSLEGMLSGIIGI